MTNQDTSHYDWLRGRARRLYRECIAAANAGRCSDRQAAEAALLHTLGRMGYLASDRPAWLQGGE